ncbi:MAG TPA: ABC transporter substrate-binding protein [Bacillota bacterium]|jgi:iron complex transport system substrate-binding protein|nr:ABC transporter substrate-binding protein [Fastidiosipila sp.]HPX93594.1 ABC transporter substrate-binding protein [Bacillota bacterium]HQB80569.1 ABC transporter substrate-binding protein [Bacillota bacterium]
MIKGKKRWLPLILAVMILALLLPAACAPATPPEETDPPQTAPFPTQEEKRNVFLDSAGREIELPTELTRIAPSGTLANIVLYTACPDLLCGISLPFTESQQKLIDPKYSSLPVMGKFYGKGPDFNLETVLAAETQVIVDIGETKGTTRDDLDQLMDQIKIPTVFIEAMFTGMPQAYRDIGRLIGDTSRTDPLALYCEETLALSDKAKAEIPEEKRVSVYWALGELGLSTNAVGSFHSEVLDFVPVINVADVEASNKGGGSEVSMEQVIGWNPDYVLIDGVKLQEEMLADPAWMSLPAMKEGRMIVVPSQPYGFLADPPSVNRYLGLRWLGSIFYPQVYSNSLHEEVRDFLELFYGISADDSQIEAILAGRFA